MAPPIQLGPPKYLAIKQPGKCRVIAIPVPMPKEYPAAGLVGDVCWTSSWNGVCLEIMGKKFVVPFDCVEVVDESPIQDEELVAVMLDNPYGVYKLMRGLWRMTKNPTIRNFMERGELPPDGFDLVKRNNKSPADYNKQWEEAESVGMPGQEEAALTGAFQGEIIS